MELQNTNNIDNTNNIIENQSKQLDAHAKWLNELLGEYTNLVETQQFEYSPNTRKKMINNIWKNDQKKPPWLTRQNGHQTEN